jgi:hypothetical protein
MRDLLWRCDEHRGPDADFPALRGKQVAEHSLILSEQGSFGSSGPRNTPTI